VISTIFSAYYITVLYFAVDFQGDWFFLLITYYVTLQCGIMLGYVTHTLTLLLVERRRPGRMGGQW
jgi:hypothetical protein